MLAPIKPSANTQRKLLALDSVGGLLVGTLVLLTLPWLARWEQQATWVLVVTGVGNISYGTYSGTLWRRTTQGRPPSRGAIRMLVIANACWAPVCGILIAMTWQSTNWLGVAHLAAEGGFVFGLAIVEWRLLLTPSAQR